MYFSVKRKITGRIAGMLAALSLCMTAAVPAMAEENGEIRITSAGAFVMDFETGAELYSLYPDTALASASMTKIMTAYLIFEALADGRIAYDTAVPISENVYRKSRNLLFYNTVPLNYDELYTVRELLELMLVHSASATAVALAELSDGTEEAFAARMNAKAAEMGIAAQYNGASGIEENYISPRGMATLARSIISDYPEVLDYTAKSETNFHGKTYKSTNHLLTSQYYEGADGLKTGTTLGVTYCFTGTAVRGGIRIISVTMRSSSGDNRFNDTKALLDYGFSVRESKLRELYPATDIDISDDSLELKPGDSAALTAIVSPENAADKRIYWTSGNNGAATVDQNGVVTAVLPGKALITAATVSGGAYKSCIVTVTGEGSFVPYYDVSRDDWFYSSVLFMYERGLLGGFPEDTYEPNAEMSRRMCAYILHLQAGLPESGSSRMAFTDVSADRQYAPAISWALESGVMMGYSENEFMPGDPLTREQLATVFYRLAGMSGEDMSAPPRVGLSIYADESDVSDWARNAMAWAIDAGIVVGTPDMELKPLDAATRAQFAAMLMRFSLPAAGGGGI
jgi:D-alanyl-D-alanine carboxypeptidase (penicillin-binding protein 5/6)